MGEEAIREVGGDQGREQRLEGQVRGRAFQGHRKQDKDCDGAPGLGQDALGVAKMPG